MNKHSVRKIFQQVFLSSKKELLSIRCHPDGWRIFNENGLLIGRVEWLDNGYSIKLSKMY